MSTFHKTKWQKVGDLRTSVFFCFCHFSSFWYLWIILFFVYVVLCCSIKIYSLFSCKTSSTFPLSCHLHFCPSPLQCVTLKIWTPYRFRAKDSNKNCRQQCLKYMRKLSPSRSSEKRWECKMGKKDDDDGTDLLIRGAWGGLGTESLLCCPGWNFVLEKCLTLSNPNCTQWGVSTLALPTGLVTAP